MDRRQRHIKIIECFPKPGVSFFLGRVVARRQLTALNDMAIEELTRELLGDRSFGGRRAHAVPRQGALS